MFTDDVLQSLSEQSRREAPVLHSLNVLTIVVGNNGGNIVNNVGDIVGDSFGDPV